MSNTHPFTEAHAIARLDFALIFQNDLTDEQRAALALVLQKHLDQFERIDANDADDEPVIAFNRKAAESDEITETVHIHENYVHVIWSDYRGWSISRDCAIAYLGPVLEWVREGRLALASVGLAYRDVFFNDEPDTYEANEILKIGNDYVAPKVFSAGKSWRHWLAWGGANLDDANLMSYSTLRIEANLLSVEEGDTSIHCTEIIHRQNVSRRDDLVFTDPSDDQLRNIWDSAHYANRALLRELITDDMLERIGLKEGSNERPLHH